MKKLKIFGLLSSIRSIELKRFEKYIESDSHYSSRNYKPLSDYLLKFYPDFSSKELTLEAMYDTLYPGKKFNHRVIISRLSELNRMVENFLLSRRLENNNYIRSRLLAEELMERKEFDTFDLVINKMIKEKHEKPELSEQYLYELDQLMMIRGSSCMLREEFSDASLILKDHIEIFIIYFLSRLFSMYGFIRNLEEFQLPGDSLKYLEQYMKNIDFENMTKIVSKANHSVYIDIIFKVHKLNMSGFDDELYFECKEKFYRNISLFDTYGKFIIFNFLYIYCIHQINTKRCEFDKEIYELLNNIILHRSYSIKPKDHMPSMLFRETVITGLKLKDHSGINKFIKNYSGELAPEYKNTVVNFCLGKLRLSEKKYYQAITLYNKCPKNILIITIDIKMDLLMCYYELGLIEEIGEEMQKNHSFLNSPVVIPDVHRILYEKFILTFEKLFNLFLKPDNEKIDNLIKEINGFTVLNYKNWLLKKLEKLLIK